MTPYTCVACGRKSISLSTTAFWMYKNRYEELGIGYVPAARTEKLCQACADMDRILDSASHLVMRALRS